MNKKEILKYLLETNTSISFPQLLLCMASAVLLGLFIYFTYKLTYTGVMYSKNFNKTLVFLTIITTMVMLVIGSNLALSLGMVGSLSLIRFRTAIKEPQDIAFVFWAIGIGICCGAGIISIGIITSVILALLLWVFKKDTFDKESYLMVIKGEKLAMDEIQNGLKETTSKYKVRMQSTSSVDQEVTFEIMIKNGEAQKVVDKINAIKSVEFVNLVAFSGEMIG